MSTYSMSTSTSAAARLVLRHRPVGPPPLPALGLGDAEPGIERDRLHLDPLPLHEGKGEGGVEPAGDEADRFHLAFHVSGLACAGSSSSRRPRGRSRGARDGWPCTTSACWWRR